MQDEIGEIRHTWNSKFMSCDIAMYKLLSSRLRLIERIMTGLFSHAFQAFMACRADSKAPFMGTPSLKSAQQTTCSRLPLEGPDLPGYGKSTNTTAQLKRSRQQAQLHLEWHREYFWKRVSRIIDAHIAAAAG